MQFEYQTDQLLINKFVYFWDGAAERNAASRRASVQSLPTAHQKEPPDKSHKRTLSTSKLSAPPKHAKSGVVVDANGNNVPSPRKEFERSLLVRKSTPPVLPPTTQAPPLPSSAPLVIPSGRPAASSASSSSTPLQSPPSRPSPAPRSAPSTDIPVLTSSPPSPRRGPPTLSSKPTAASTELPILKSSPPSSRRGPPPVAAKPTVLSTDIPDLTSSPPSSYLVPRSPSYIQAVSRTELPVLTSSPPSSSRGPPPVAAKPTVLSTDAPDLTSSPPSSYLVPRSPSYIQAVSRTELPVSTSSPHDHRRGPPPVPAKPTLLSTDVPDLTSSPPSSYLVPRSPSYIQAVSRTEIPLPTSSPPSSYLVPRSPSYIQAVSRPEIPLPTSSPPSPPSPATPSFKSTASLPVTSSSQSPGPSPAKNKPSPARANVPTPSPRSATPSALTPAKASPISTVSSLSDVDSSPAIPALSCSPPSARRRPPLPTERRQQGAQQGAQHATPPSSRPHASLKPTAIPSLGKTYCQSCQKKCSGEVLRVQDKYFHIACFKCRVCCNSLAQGGFFCKDGGYYCTNDYQRQFGTKCAVCDEYVEGEVVSALGSTYHQKCFTCGRCRQAFPSGERVTYTGKEVLCAKCVQIPVRETISTQLQSNQSSPTSAGGGNECAGCHEELKDCQALIALDRQWHIYCFKCKSCEIVLHGEYMGKDGVPYCEKDYQAKFGVKCAYCSRYISGKVLQAGEDHHFHPTCARCTKCGDPFGDGEEMYLQGGAIWHPRCGPGPTENGTVLNGSGIENGHCTDTETEAESGRDTGFDRISSSAFSIRSRTPSFNGSCNSLSRKYPGGAYHRTGSPGLLLREYKQPFPEDISRIYTYSYLTEEPTQGYLRRPIDPYDKPPTSPHFHRPFSAQSGRSSKLGMSKHGSRSGMAALVDSIRSETPRPRSPHMNNEEPIELAHFPGARPPPPGEPPKIEREDFPAPPYPYTDPERRRRWSDSYKGLPLSDDEDEADGKEKIKDAEDRRLKKEEEELSKIASGIGKVFLKNVLEREKLKQWKNSNMDPRNASRTPSAAKEPAYRLRYESPVNASPSRNVDHPRPWEEDEMLDRSSSYRSSVGRSTGAIPSYNVVSALRHVPKPGYGLAPRSHTFSSTGGSVSGIVGDFSFSGLGEKTHSTELSSGKSDMSAGSISEVDRRAMNTELPVSTTYAAGLGALRSSSYSPHLRRSLPNMAHSSTDPPKVYPYHLLVITNYRLPADVDRCNLERHLSDAEFDALFGCSRADFYRLPQWRRNEMKRRVRLF